MSNVISFLERMGREAQLRHAPEDQVQMVLMDEQVSSEFREVILSKNQSGLQTLLGRTSFCCAMFPVKEGDEESEESPSKDDEEISLRDEFLAVACAD